MQVVIRLRFRLGAAFPRNPRVLGVFVFLHRPSDKRVHAC